jgi:hypothetical protein
MDLKCRSGGDRSTFRPRGVVGIDIGWHFAGRMEELRGQIERPKTLA